MDVKVTLDQAIMAAKAGRKAEARSLLEAVLDVDERNEQAWLWMGGVVDSDEERIICLQNVLTINPHNEAARKGLTALGVTPVADPSSATCSNDLSRYHEREESLAAPPPTSYAGPLGEDVPSARELTPDRRPFIAITIVLVLMLICTVISILAFVILSPTG